ncbi:MAG: helix-turn-helix domain-containing protein [Schwartzia sp.]|nr:helix-turn-helix domain-containing protein [Schwartzia sp. (in: firmicutes)]
MKNRIREFRERRDLTTDEVAKILGVDRSAVVKWETGANLPRLDKAIALAKLLRCSMDEMLGME